MLEFDHLRAVATAFIVSLSMVFSSSALAQARETIGQYRIGSDTANTAFLFKLSTDTKVVYAASISNNGTVAILDSGRMALTGLLLSRTVVAGLIRLAEAEGFFDMPPVLGRRIAPRTTPYEEIDAVAAHRARDVRLVLSRNSAFCQLYTVLLAVVGTPGPHNDPQSLC
jgi:hypothetical protein